MSLQSLRAMRLERQRPRSAYLLTMDCPHPEWSWLKDDPSLIWLSPRADVRSHDLRPLVGMPVVALVDSLAARRQQVTEAIEAAGGVLAGIAGADGAESYEFPDRKDPWPELLAQGLMIEKNMFWKS